MFITDFEYKKNQELDAGAAARAAGRRIDAGMPAADLHRQELLKELGLAKR